MKENDIIVNYFALDNNNNIIFCQLKLIVVFSFPRAAEYLVRTGPIVTLEIAKQGAIYHGLATLLSQPSPVLNRGKYFFHEN